MHRNAANKTWDEHISSLNANKEPIAIIGIGCRFPGGANNPEQFWSLLRNGVHVVSEIPSSRIDVENISIHARRRPAR